MEEDYNTREDEEQDLTCGNPQCGCVLHKNSLSPIERDLAHAILPVLKEKAQNERKYSQDT